MLSSIGRIVKVVLLYLYIFVVQLLSHASSSNFTDQNASSCGSIFSTPTIQLTSPGWPAAYPAGIQCDYFIQPFSPEVCFLQIEFLYFQLQTGDDNCNLDSLGIGKALFCGEVKGSVNIPFQEPSVIHFQSIYGGGNGFNIHIHQIECSTQQQESYCSGTFSEPRIELSSPNYPNFYPNNIECTYTLKRIHEGICQFVVTFLDSLLEDSEECIKDRLLIGEEALCGNLVGSKKYSADTDLIIRFITDDANSEKGFRLTVKQVQCTDNARQGIGEIEITPYQPHIIPYPQLLEPLNRPYPQFLVPGNPMRQLTWPQNNPQFVQPQVSQSPNQYQCCGRAYNEKHFLLISPGFPRSQPSDCIYSITKNNPSTYQLRFQFIFFWIDEQNNNNQNCINEFLEIDGKQFCGCKTGLILTSTFQEVWETEKVIRLKTSYVSNRPFSGFVLEVFQDDNTLTRSKRNSTDVYQKYFSDKNVNSDLILRRNFQNTESQNGVSYVWDPIQQFWTLSQNILCLRWGINDWIILIRELLWSQYQCTGNSNIYQTASVAYPLYVPQYGK